MAAKMEHFIWKGYFPGSGYAFAESQEGLTSEQTIAMRVGTKLPEPLPKVTITRLSEGELPDLLESVWASKVVSAKLKGVLEKNCPKCIQYIPVKLEEYPNLKYWIANVLTSIPCLDREKSKVTTSPQPPHAVRRVSKLVLKPIPGDAPALFHMEELPAAILVSANLRQALESASESAGEFIVVKEYRRPARY